MVAQTDWSGGDFQQVGGGKQDDSRGGGDQWDGEIKGQRCSVELRVTASWHRVVEY